MAPDRAEHAPWDESYRHGPPPWDAGGPRAAVVRLCEQGVFRGPLLDAGCGTGEDALEIASRGIEVVGLDCAPTAIGLARDRAAERGIAATFIVGDALELDRLGRTFRSVLDCGLFHTFDDEGRAAYVESLAAVIAPGGVLHLLCVSEAATGELGPRRRVSEAELRAAFGSGWDILSIEPARVETRFEPGHLPGRLAAIERA